MADGGPLRGDTASALFTLDALDPMTDQALRTAADHLVTNLHQLAPGVQVATRLTTRSSA